ncbi:MAG: DUF5597 domain-containing protein [Lachnospiraceae bacterium]|nr:DUF5597 domain-containing protein [Lachnospiraceae bacterium]
MDIKEGKKEIPEIRMLGGIPTLYVENHPFFAYAGEVHNSSACSLEYMEKHVWNQIEELHLNSLLIPVYWEQIEPEEGIFRYEIIDGLIGQARQRKMRIIFLWFGLWKNGESMYVPQWMKRNSQKYFRVEKGNREKINTISPFSNLAVEKDAVAFSELMEHIKQQDKERNTVIAMQVENEVGLLGTQRDHCKAAEEKFSQQIPEQLAEEYETKGTWEEAFGEDAGEYFMAYYFAAAVERIVSRGRGVYPLPCYTNAWLKQHPWYAGSYPSGGPVKEMHRIWKIASPSLFTLAPDIYVPYTADVIETYSYPGNPLFIPEVRRDAATASYCLYAFLKCHAICYSPFGIEDLGIAQEAAEGIQAEVMQVLNINPAMFAAEGGREYLGRTYSLLQDMEPLYLKYRGTEHMQCYVKKSETDFGRYLRFKEYHIVIDYLPAAVAKPLAAGVIFELSENQFLIAGMMSRLTFSVKMNENKNVSILRLQEGIIDKGKWIPTRTLNGDEGMVLGFGDVPAFLYVELYKY